MANPRHEKVSPTSSGRRTVTLHVDAAINSLSLNREATQAVIAGRNVFKIIGIDYEFAEHINLRVGKNSLNFATADVAWNHNDDNILASGATNGSVIIWDLNKKSKSKLDAVLTEHKRAVNRVCFHRSEAHTLLSADQNGYMFLFDLRSREVSETFIEPVQSNVRDIQFCPFDPSNFCAATENGTIQMWDTRRNDRYVWEHLAQAGPIYTIDWHPEERGWIATAGRDHIIKVWDTTKMSLKYSIQTITDVGRIKWRPQRRYHIASCALQLDCNINVWDVRRPYIPFAAFTEHTDVAKAIVWKQDPHVFLSGGRDHVLIEHVFSDAKRPADYAIPAGLNLSAAGHVTFALGDKSATTNAKPGTRITTLFKKNVDRGNQFLDQVTSSAFSTQSMHAEVDVISMASFVDAAKRYMLSGHSLHVICDYNSAVAYSLGLTQISQTWRSIKLLYPSSNGAKILSKAHHSTPQTGDKSDTDHRNRSNTGASYHHGSDVEVNSSASEYESEPDMKLATIASRMASQANNFFGNDDDMDIDYDTQVLNFDPSKADLTLQLEGFHHRHNILDKTAPPEDLHNNTADSPASANESDLSSHIQPPPPTVHPLLATPIADQLPRLSCTDLIVNTLTELAEQGDIQSAVSILLVLGSKIQPHISPDLQELWCTSYIELLSKFELWNKANEVILLSGLSEVNSLNQQSTMVYTKCNKCNKPLQGVGWLCGRCKSHTNPCSVCNEPVRGMYVWCQGCSHGGHLQHMKHWFQCHTLCPTGCGHLCEYT